MTHRIASTLAAAGAFVLALAASPGSLQAAGADPRLEHGRYIVQIAGCNDCHTAGFAPSGGKVPESEWLKGDSLGWRGPWGTTYAPNLRRYMQPLSESEWVKAARTLKTRPPMPWWALHHMSDQDLRAMYRFVRSLGEPGPAAPAYLPPDTAPKPPYVEFVPGK